MFTQLSNKNSLIAKNTHLFYFRMLVTMAMALCVSRVVLNTLGVDYYGIFNAGGIVFMLSFKIEI